MIEETLRSIGLSHNETRIYLSLLELGPTQMGALCAKTKIHRRNVYDSVEMLKDKGFVSSTIINNRNVFEAVAPQRILDIFDEKRIDIESILPTLMASQGKKSAIVRVYTGINGMKIVFEEKLKCKEVQFVLGAHEASGRFLPYLDNYHKRRLQKKIQLKMLFCDKKAAMRFLKYGLVEVRILPKRFSSPIAVNIYASKTAILLGSGTSEPITIVIDDIGLADDFRVYFEMLWKASSMAISSGRN